MTNKEILLAVIIEWAKPVIPVLAGNRLGNMPVLNMFENWVKKIGVAPPNWTVAQDIVPLIQGGAYNLIVPFIVPKLDGIPDEFVPQMAHGIVDAAIQNGECKLFGGFFTFDKSDLQELKSYLDCNLPYTPKERYIVKKPEADGKKE